MFKRNSVFKKRKRERGREGRDYNRRAEESEI
jgi:hypothetical protein